MKRIIELADKHSMFHPGIKVLCAVSGGADSMCLLHWLHTHREETGAEVAAAHFEHGIRGEESLRDMEFVRDFCQSNGIEFVCRQSNVPRYAKEHSLSIEEAARKLRYEFLYESAEALGCESIATAHNLNDNAETVIFNLARGGGAAGLCGIPPVRDRIIRPLLGVSRKEIEHYLEENSVPHVEDSTNSTDEYTRNTIRHNVVPVLREINSAFEEAVYKTTLLLSDDEDYISREAERFISENYDGRSIPADRLCRLHKAVASRVVRKLCRKSLSYEHVNAVLDIAGSKELRYADIPGMRVACERGRLVFGEEKGEKLPETAVVPGQTLVFEERGIKISTEILSYSGEVHGLFNILNFKCGEIYGCVRVGSWQDGDRIRIKGRNCTKSLKALFNERKYTQQQKQNAIVFRDDKGVLAVYGIGTDERVYPTEGERCLKITIEST